MSFDILKNHVVQLKVNNCQSTGVIFKPVTDTDFLYILTAKHNFFYPKENAEKHYDLELNLEDKEIAIIHETTNQQIYLSEKTVYFFEPETINGAITPIDLAIIIINKQLIKEKTNIPSIDILSIADDQNSHTSIYDTQYSLFGYPSYRNYLDKNISHCKLKFSQTKTACFFKEEFENTTGFIGFDESDHFQNELDGISGSPIFLLSKTHIPYLRSIAYATENFNIIKTIKINALIDKINERLTKIGIENHPINLSTKIILLNETLNISELNNFDDFKKRVREKSESIDFIKENEENQIFIKEKASELSEEGRKLREMCENISYKYAHIAIIAAENGLKSATTSYLKKATEWNSDHIHLLLHERAERTQNKELLKSLTPFLVRDKIKKYDKLIKIENNQDEVRELLKEAIKELTPHLSNEQDRKIVQLKITDYCIDLENIFHDNTAYKPIEKYRDIAKFYYENHLTKKSFKFYAISAELLQKASKNDYHKSLLEETSKRLVEIQEKNKDYDFATDLQEAQNIAKKIIEEDEDKDTKDIILKLYEDVNTLKNKDQDRDEFYKDLMENLLSLNISINKQIIQNVDNNLNIKKSNGNIESFSSLLRSLENQLSEIPERYDIQIDENTRSELRSIIEEPASAISSTLNKIDVITDKASTYVDNAENSFNTLVKHGKDDLLIINSSIQENLSSLSEQKIKLENDKNEVLAFLKSSEKRMLAHIHKLELNAKRKNDAITFIQNKIHDLQKLVSKALLVQSDNHSDIIELSNKFTQELKQITLACQQLEKQLQESLDYTSDIESIKRAQTRVEHTLVTKTSEALFTHAQYHDDIIAIKHNQNRFEESLLNQTNHALKNYERIVDYNIRNPPLSFGKKVLLALYFIIMISSATYFIVNYGLLDLLEHLWQTA